MLQTLFRLYEQQCGGLWIIKIRVTGIPNVDRHKSNKTGVAKGYFYSHIHSSQVETANGSTNQTNKENEVQVLNPKLGSWKKDKLSHLLQCVFKT